MSSSGDRSLVEDTSRCFVVTMREPNLGPDIGRTMELTRDESTGERMSDLANQMNQLSLDPNAEVYVVAKLIARLLVNYIQEYNRNFTCLKMKVYVNQSI